MRLGPDEMSDHGGEVAAAASDVEERVPALELKVGKSADVDAGRREVVHTVRGAEWLPLVCLVGEFCGEEVGTVHCTERGLNGRIAFEGPLRRVGCAV